MEYEHDVFEDLEYENHWKETRKRNLKINIAKQLIISNLTDRKTFTRQELKDIFAFKESDIIYIAPDLFDFREDKYIMIPEFSEFTDKVVISNKNVKNYLASAEVEFIKIYGRFLVEMKKDIYMNGYRDKYKKMFNKLKEIIPIIHWGRLPIFNKYLLYNRSKDPELEMLEYYDHVDCLSALLKDVKNNGISLSNKSDDTLNREMPFEVYCRRWGCKDRYFIKRTISGWYCKYIALSGECKKNGEGGLFNNLEHDNIFYPKDGVASAMEKLWEAADDGYIDFEELSKRLQQVADWISEVEISIRAQPEWVGYY